MQRIQQLPVLGALSYLKHSQFANSRWFSSAEQPKNGDGETIDFGKPIPPLSLVDWSDHDLSRLFFNQSSISVTQTSGN